MSINEEIEIVELQAKVKRLQLEKEVLEDLFLDECNSTFYQCIMDIIKDLYDGEYEYSEHKGFHNFIYKKEVYQLKKIDSKWMLNHKFKN
tara:strand:+ start:17106 stop:17375 length:270 start_codon:yes stop_codon:yes gene_type:complete